MRNHLIEIDGLSDLLPVEILDISSRPIMNNVQLSANKSISVSHLPKEIYFVKIVIDGQSITKKIIKE
ncbi:MAG: T9SS type A sorting domain-containing protein [Candidatus Symbiothrix sp.]|nr:T9SS type A sorting domain-containing protein [Candidatus Symbiothrix sp.]